MLVPFPGHAGNLQSVDFDVLFLQHPDDILNAAGMGILDVQDHIVYLSGKAVLQLDEQQLRHDHGQGGGQSTLHIARAADQPDDGRGPKTGGGGQALDLLAIGDDDGTRADKADTGDNLGAQAAHIGKKVHFQTEILAGQGGHSRAQADENMGAKARRTALVFPLQADNAAADNRQNKAHGHSQKGHIPNKIKA